MVGDSYIHEICKAEYSSCDKYKTSKEIAFWLQHLPRLFSMVTSNEQAEKIITTKGIMSMTLKYVRTKNIRKFFYFVLLVQHIHTNTHAHTTVGFL